MPQSADLDGADSEAALQALFSDLHAVLRHHSSTAKDAHYNSGSAGLHAGGNAASRVQAAYLMALARSERVRTICEVGWNWGGSSALWLSAKPTTQVVAFDLMDKSYSWAAFDELDRHFPARLRIIAGDSEETVPAVDLAGQCDIVLVDGEHTFDAEFANILNLRRLAAPDATLVVDDCSCARPHSEATRAWVLLVAEGLIHERETWTIDGIAFDTPGSRVYGEVRNWCVGTYSSAAG